MDTVNTWMPKTSLMEHSSGCFRALSQCGLDSAGKNCTLWTHLCTSFRVPHSILECSRLLSPWAGSVTDIRHYLQSCGWSNYSEISGMFGCASLFLAPISRKLCITANRLGVHYRNQSNVRLIRYINENSAIALEHAEYIKSGLRKKFLFRRRQWGVAPGQHWALVVPLLVKRPEAVEAWQKTPMYLAFGAVDKCVQMCSILYLLWVKSGQWFIQLYLM